MSYAGHLPTMQFNHLDWLRMPVWAPKDAGEYPPDGWSRTIGRGNKPVVVYFSPVDSGEVSFAVRPIVRVKAWRRDLAPVVHCEHCGSSGMQRYCSRCP